MVTDDEQRALDAAYFETFGEPKCCTISEADSRFRAAVGLTHEMIAWQDAHPCSNPYDRKYFYPRATSRARRYGYAPCGTFIECQCGDPSCKCSKCFEAPKFCVSCIPACVEARLAEEPAREWCAGLPTFQVPRIVAGPACPSSWSTCESVALVVIIDAKGRVLESTAAAALGLCALLDAEFPGDAPHVARSLVGPKAETEGTTS